MGNSYDARNPFEPRITQAYTHYDPITGSRDRTGDENVRRKVLVASSVTQAEGIVGNDQGTLFVVPDGASAVLHVYVDEGSAVQATLS